MVVGRTVRGALNRVQFSTGYVTLGGELDVLRLDAGSGGTFTAGSIVVKGYYF
jgi:hypothetical protein